MMMILIRMTFITVADDNDGAVADDNDDQLFICLFSNLFVVFNHEKLLRDASEAAIFYLVHIHYYDCLGCKLL